MLYTDGFVESARRDIDTGIVQLTTALATTTDTAPLAPATGPWARSDEQEQTDEAGLLGRLCASLTATLLPEGEQTGDDAAVLVARVRALRSEDMCVWTLPEDPVAAGQARSHIRRRLAEWQLEELVTTTELLASELVGNVIRHARGPLRLRLVRSRSLICEVSDGSLTTPASAVPWTPTKAGADCNWSPRSVSAGASATRSTASASGPSSRCRTPCPRTPRAWHRPETSEGYIPAPEPSPSACAAAATMPGVVLLGAVPSVARRVGEEDAGFRGT